MLGVAHLSSNRAWTSYTCGFTFGTPSSIATDTADSTWLTFNQGGLYMFSPRGFVSNLLHLKNFESNEI